VRPIFGWAEAHCGLKTAAILIVMLSRLSALVGTALFLSAAASGAATPRTSLTVTYWPHGPGTAAKTWHLSCAPAAGTHPLKGIACTELANYARELAPPRAACKYLPPKGAPEALVKGVYRGKPVNRLVRPTCDPTVLQHLFALLTGLKPPG
jgi:hypothetical protein